MVHVRLRRLLQITAAALWLISFSPAANAVRSTDGHAGATSYPYTSTSIYEHNVDPATLYSQGCARGKDEANGVIILDFGRPAYRPALRGYGAYDFGGQVDLNADILTAMESFASGFRHCLPSGSNAHVSIARGTNNSCSNQDPRCCPSGCKYQPPSFANAGKNWAIWTARLQSYISSHAWGKWMSSSAADDVEPAWDPAYTNTSAFLSAYAAQYGYTYTMWDYGSLDPGYWSSSQEYMVAYGYKPNVPVPQIYSSTHAQQWEALDLWSVANLGHAMKIWGVTSESRPGYNCGYTSHEGYDAMLAALQSHASTYQSSITYLTRFPCGTA